MYVASNAVQNLCLNFSHFQMRKRNDADGEWLRALMTATMWYVSSQNQSNVELKKHKKFKKLKFG